MVSWQERFGDPVLFFVAPTGGLPTCWEPTPSAMGGCTFHSAGGSYSFSIQAPSNGTAAYYSVDFTATYDTTYL